MTIQLTNWGKLTGNDKAVEEIKSELLRIVEKINTNLKNLENDVQKFEQIIKPTLTNYLNDKIKRVKLKNDTTDKLNPFQ